MNTNVKLSDEQHRNLQLNELELIVEVDRICRKYNINYSLDGGTLLGAVRHKGFVPWDEDADVIFTRHEYAKFYRACKKELKRNEFFLQEYRTDPYYRWGYAKLRHKDTEYVRSGQEHLKYKTGICIDVFVVDNVPDNKIARSLFYIYNVLLRKILYSEIGKDKGNNILLRSIYNLLYRVPRNVVFKMRNAVAYKCNKKDTKLVSHLLYPYPKKDCKYGMPAECFSEYIELEFEGMKFKAIKDYDRYLTLLYGDYMTPPPEEDRNSLNVAASKILTKEITLQEIQDRYKKENI